MVKSGLLPGSFRSNQMNEDFCCFICAAENKAVHRVRRLNWYKRKRLAGGQFSDQLHSHWHPNLTVNLVHDNRDNIEFVDFYFNDQL